MFKVKQTRTFSDGTKNEIVLPNEFSTIDDVIYHIQHNFMDDAWNYFTYAMSERDKERACRHFSIRDKEVSDMTFENTATHETWHWDILEIVKHTANINLDK